MLEEQFAELGSVMMRRSVFVLLDIRDHTLELPLMKTSHLAGLL
jgi:hypothetical protein